MNVTENVLKCEKRERDKLQQKRRMDRKVEGVAIDTKLIPDTPQKRSQDISEILPEDMIDLPEIKEEKHVTLMGRKYDIKYNTICIFR